MNSFRIILRENINRLRVIRVPVLVLVMLFSSMANAAWRESLPPELAVPELMRMGLEGLSVEKVFHHRLEKFLDPEDRYFLVVRLGRLTETQFNRIDKLYGNRSPADYNPEREYRLKDFLPPVVQAVLNKTFTPIGYDLSFLKKSSYQRKIRKLKKASPIGEEGLMVDGLLWNGLSTETNCWNATVETLNAINAGTSTYRIFTPPRWEIDRELKSAYFGKPVTSESKLQQWDTLLISEKSPYTGIEILQHTALVINKQLVFEKVGSTADHPYRLSLRQDVIGKYRRALADTYRSEYRRYGSGYMLFRDTGFRSEAYPKLTSKIIGKISPVVQPERLTYGCDSGQEDKCTYSFQVVETLIVESGSQGGTLRGSGRILSRFQSLENH